jgi:hypothetical protein
VVEAFVTIEVFPFPRFHAYDTAPVDVFGKFTASGAQPELGVVLNAAIGCALATKLTQNNEHNKNIFFVSKFALMFIILGFYYGWISRRSAFFM